ncbi:MAG: glutamate racemase [Anaerolineales bacterium]|nr:glutamate racemase [Anaerolineales bacterium]
MIGILDSGVGGLSVLRHIRAQLPDVGLAYLADQAHVPYGTRSLAEIRQFSEGIVRFLLAQGSQIIVVACNTASAAALTHLRGVFPQTPIVGMEPAVKPAAAHTRTGKVGVLATAGTFESPRYASLMQRYAQNIEVLEDPCLGLVGLIEAGNVAGKETAVLLHTILSPMLAAGVDTLVLGCTHYPFVEPLITQIVAQSAHKPDPFTIIDPAPAVARQTRRVWQENHSTQAPSATNEVRLFTTGNAIQMAALTKQLLGETFKVETAVWQGDILIPA